MMGEQLGMMKRTLYCVVRCAYELKVHVLRSTTSFVLWFFLTGCTLATVPVVPTAVSTTSPPLPTVAESVLLPATSTAVLPVTPTRATAVNLQPAPTETAVIAPTPTSAPSADPTATWAVFGNSRILGRTVENRPIMAYNFGYGSDHIVFIGGMHGGYEWNTIALAYEAIDHFTAHPEQIPPNVQMTIIPSVNVDGQVLVTGSDGRVDTTATYTETAPGRFNANEVDLNRNWDCEWSEIASWQNREVSGGEAPFSESESEVLRRFFLWERPELVVFWHSKANGVYAAGCPGTYPPSLEWATLYGEAAGYPVYENFTAYPITGDAGNWLATQGIPSFTVELKTHTGTDWPENLAGMQAVLAEYEE